MNSSSLYVRALYPITNTISRTAPSAGVMAVAFSAWFGTRTVGSPEYWVFFAWFGAWLAVVALFAVASSLQGNGARFCYDGPLCRLGIVVRLDGLACR